jgi:hypothetical protein
MKEQADSENDSDVEQNTSSSSSTIPVLSFDFSSNVDHVTNMKVIERAADLVWKEQSVTDPVARTHLYF